MNAEDAFDHSRILFIGAESYDGPAITVLQGLEELGFEVHTIQKDNINAWFCNTIVTDPESYEYDFVLSNIHWGTRWSHYRRYDLEHLPHVLIDGDDNTWLCESWRCKQRQRNESYEMNPPEEIKQRELAPSRWVEPIGDYEPDVVFTSQKLENDDESIYLPFGIHREYLNNWDGSVPGDRRSIDLAHIPGPGGRRQRGELALKILNTLTKIPLQRATFLPGNVFNDNVRGEPIVPDQIEDRFEKDDNVHSYHRWTMYEGYFETLRDSKAIFIPGTDDWPGWDNKRHYEALACGCLPLWLDPPTDISAYSMGDLHEYLIADSYWDFVRRYKYLYQNPDVFERVRRTVHERALKYFSPTAIARYFLSRISDTA
jgi:hypothetical protein